jgi:hypothetical protein
MLRRLLKNHPPETDLFRWLHDLAEIWCGEDNYYTFWFTGAWMPRRNYQIRVNQFGQKKVEDLMWDAIRSYKKVKLVELGKIEEGLAEAMDLINGKSHYSRLHIHEAVPFLAFFMGLLQTVEIYGLELTGEGKQAMTHVEKACLDEKYRTGNLSKVGDLLLELDQMVDGRLLAESLSEADAGKDMQSSMSSSWLDFYPPLIPFWDITLHLDIYVQPAHSEEQWAEHKKRRSNHELGCQQIDPSHETADAAEGHCPSPT